MDKDPTEPTDIPVEFYDTYIREAEKVYEEYEEALLVAQQEFEQRMAEEEERGA